MTDPFDSLTLDHIELYVADLEFRVSELTGKYGFHLVAASPAEQRTHRSVLVRQSGISLLLTQGFADDHPASGYVHVHGDGVANIALRTPDARVAYGAAVTRGAEAIAAPAPVERSGHVVATIRGFGDVLHTLMQWPADSTEDDLPPGLVPVSGRHPVEPAGLLRVDHLAVCVPAGELDPTVAYYEAVLDFSRIFQERITVGRQAMNSQVVQNRAGDVTLTLLEPDTQLEAGQIDDFVKNHGGAGVQHIAFSAHDIVASVATLGKAGVEFLTTPASYYSQLPKRMELARHDVNSLRDLNILADSDHAGQLYQIFTRSTFPRKTLFLEVIERFGAETFGSGNIKALYEAVELDRTSPEHGN
ncbi:4-hydroxyphenylpyruvate dioxygenase [Actinoplanes palleronii]|uniref:4-hydroxyphenylpyruvate dioxygenase n=1 Tax=Actinoplanes palleronii TaxID=113570 RepID=A0ABQ4BIW4_9ACTN|nr:4-hydroxyphenylpyruvate dioxygenase [Actinoplanes palleronii]GIE70626.1 4-hydroxyphenylpyruvate dioxygenase [Actinoplanes palleronii]